MIVNIVHNSTFLKLFIFCASEIQICSPALFCSNFTAINIIYIFFTFWILMQVHLFTVVVSSNFKKANEAIKKMLLL